MLLSMHLGPKLLLVVGSITLCSPAYAHNNLFLPGDAYFVGELTEHTQIDAKHTLKLSYRWYHKSKMRCGYAGYKELHIAMSKRLRENLNLAREHANKPPWAYGGHPILVYNRTFPNDYPFFLRFNEKAEQVQKRVFRRNHATATNTRVESADRFNDRHAERIRPLAIAKPPRIPSSKQGQVSGPFIGELEPLKISGSKTKLIILEQGDVEDYASKKSQHNV